MVVIGGGLAGIAAAVRLADHGVAVTLVETRKRLGGRATSFSDPSTGHVLDNCQHVLMGCCTNLIDLYRRLGVEGYISWHRRLYFTDGSGVIDTLEADDLPAPLHMTRSLMAFKSLSLSEKIAISRGMLAILRLGQAGREKLHGMTFERWLTQQHQPVSVIRKFWSVIVTSALNEQPQRVDAAYAIQVFQEGFLANENAYVMGLPTVPLVRLYDTAQRIITDAGGAVMMSAGADGFICGQDQSVASIRLSDGRELCADAFVSAVPFDRLDKLCTPAMRQADPRLQRLVEITTSPIIGIHMWFDTPSGQPIMKLPHLILTDSPLHWIFNKGDDPQLAGQHLHGVISAGYEWVGESADRIIDMAVGEVRKALSDSPVAASARLLHGRVVKEKRATFSATPGIEALRPAVQGAIQNLYLAGDWCQTGWPATMEGAVRSGYHAATAVLQSLRLSSQPMVPDLPNHQFYQLLCQQPVIGSVHV